MFKDLDDTLQQLLDDPAMPTALNDLRNADVSFETPDKNFTPGQATVNLFLFEMKENRELRDPVPIQVNMAGVTLVRKPPIRMDCVYLVTVWPSSTGTGAAKVAEEHRLLGQVLRWLSRFSSIPSVYFQGSMVGQPFPPPLSVAQIDPNRNSGDFWLAMGISPRPAFFLTATIAIDLDIEVESPLVSTVIAWYQQDGDATSREEWIIIGGTVLDFSGGNAAGEPVAGATVRLDPGNLVVQSDEQGRFLFNKTRRGTNFTLRAGLPRLGEISRTVDIPSPTGEYNLRFP
jgi:hypothetical protein